jgi:hypothetical protein
LASITPAAGGIFQTYRSVVTPDGQVVSEPGTEYIWPEGGISWFESPAPDGQYNLGFLIEAFGGATGFDSTTVTVNNSGVNTDLEGYIDSGWGFIFQRPAGWSRVSYFVDGQYDQSGDPDGNQAVYVYGVYDETDLETIATQALEPYNVTLNDDFTPVTIADTDALSFTYTYTYESGGEGFGQAFVLYNESKSVGLVFASEGRDESETARIYDILRDNLTFFDSDAVKAQDQGLWESDYLTTAARETYPVRKDWLPGAETNGWWYYRPGDDPTSTTFAALTVMKDLSDDVPDVLHNILDTEIGLLPNYELIGTETYYGENNTWEMASFTHDGADGEPIIGRLYATTSPGGKPYLLWFEAPSEEFDALLKDVFYVMLDGFEIKAEPEAES